MSKNLLKQIAKKNEYQFFHKKNTNSTMSEVRDYLIKNKKNCIFLSDQQKKGKGQRGKQWHSPIGNIYCSISFENLFQIKEHFIFSILIATSIKMTLQKFNAKHIKFKWPNDIFYKNMKFSGMISESLFIDKINKFMIVGFGININSSPNIPEYPTTYVKSFCDIKNINNFLEIFFNILFINLEKINTNNKKELINHFKKFLMFKNKNISIKLPNDSIINGVFKDLNNDGSLQLQSDKRIENIYNGKLIL